MTKVCLYSNLFQKGFKMTLQPTALGFLGELSHSRRPNIYYNFLSHSANIQLLKKTTSLQRIFTVSTTSQIYTCVE